MLGQADQGKHVVHLRKAESAATSVDVSTICGHDWPLVSLVGLGAFGLGPSARIALQVQRVAILVGLASRCSSLLKTA